jgi:hypothetical protein
VYPGTVDGHGESALFCCALVGMLAALLARAAWAADRRSPIQATLIRPTDAGRIITMW